MKAEQLIADLEKRRDEFEALAKKQVEAGEAAWQRAQPQLEVQWNGFEAQLKGYVEIIGRQIEQQQATFREVAVAQVKAWREAADRLRNKKSKWAAPKRADIDAAVKQMKADAAEADARLQKLKQAGSKSWLAFSAALADSRKAFDRANQAALEHPQTRRGSEILEGLATGRFSAGMTEQNGEWGWPRMSLSRAS